MDQQNIVPCQVGAVSSESPLTCQNKTDNDSLVRKKCLCRRRVLAAGEKSENFYSRIALKKKKKIKRRLKYHCQQFPPEFQNLYV